MITYKQLLDLGFEREESDDNVHFEKYGYKAFYMVFKIKNYALQWDCIDMEVILYKGIEQRNIFDLSSIEKIKQIIDFLK